MTCCIATLAADSKAIVCVADKAVSTLRTQFDTDTSKIIPLRPCNVLALISGDFGHIDAVLRRLRTFDFDTNKADIIASLQVFVRDAAWDVIEQSVLSRRMLTHDDYVRAIASPQPNSLMVKVAAEMLSFRPRFSLLVCGFDRSTNPATPYILQLSWPDLVTDKTINGCAVIGSGAHLAPSRLAFSGSKRTHSIERVLYDTFDAKADAENAVGVGYAWDAQVIQNHRPIADEVPATIREVIEKVCARYTRSPFEWDREPDYDDFDDPPGDWQQQLKDYANSLAP